MISNHPPAQVKAKLKLAKKIVDHHFGKGKREIEFKPAGKTNFVFEVNMSKAKYIVRIATTRSKIHNFIKEQWATEKAKDMNIPVPEILEVGDEVIDLPYMLQEKLSGKEAVDHPQRLDILEKLGSYARLIHTIPTNGFGHLFDWSGNKLSRKKTWNEFLKEELCVDQGLRFLRDQSILSRAKIKKLEGYFSKIRKWKISPCLNHGDLRLKNVIVNDEGKIQAIIDWDNCCSSIAPYWDLSIALHDLSIDGKQHFLKGYGLNFDEFNRMSYALTAFNFINYIPSLERVIKGRNQVNLELYKLRLNGALDLFSL